ncbi:MAG: flavin reductase [Oscillospiraceae bacterium]|nr:flavin reductase [Oscillospiraceae bacterium]MBR2635813.1 flavin reductase [Oscillospiraceae bacterium]
MERFDVDAFKVFDKQWALVSAGTPEDYNTMTISWGGLGTLWSRPVATVYVKPIRYTYEYLEKNEYFTVSFFPEEYKKDLGVLGSKSGRDGDKVALTGLHAVKAENSVTFREASATLLCKKIYWQDLDPAQMPAEVIDTYYKTEAAHRMYIGEVVGIIR